MRSNIVYKLTKRLLKPLNQAARSIAFRRYSLARFYTRTVLNFTRVERPVLIYTMGKVGSSTLAHSIRRAAPELDVFHLHWLVPENLARDESLYRAAARVHKGTALEGRFYPHYIWVGQHLSSVIKSPPTHGDRWTVLTLIRDPVARNVSSFFQNLLLFFGYDVAQELRSKTERVIVAELCELFQASFLTEDWVRQGKDSDPLTWFDEELRRAFDIDVFEVEFPTNVGFKIYTRPRVRVLLARLEDLDRCAPQAMEQFLGLRRFELHRQNIGLDKGYSSLYREFLESVELPEEYLDRMYDSRFSRHFYTEEELTGFRVRWRTRLPESIC